MTTFEKAKRQYNNLMFDICREYNTIETSFTEDKENRNKWNLRDLVSEVQYTLDIYEDPSCIYWEEAHDRHQPPHKPWYKEWVSTKNKMKRFINRYKDEAIKLDCWQAHCSDFD
jgi:hypothetical protein